MNYHGSPPLKTLKCGLLLALIAAAQAAGQESSAPPIGRPGSTVVAPEAVARPATPTIAGAPSAPLLDAPANGATVEAPEVRLQWRAGPGSPAPTRFEICIYEIGTSCSSSGALWYRSIEDTQRVLSAVGSRSSSSSGTPITGTRLDVVLPPRLQTRPLRWTVSACAPRAVHTTIAGTSTALACTASTPRALSWTFTPPGNLRIQTGAGPFQPTFSWSGVPAAESYLFCVSRPGVACPMQPVDNADTLVVASDRYTHYYQPPSDFLLARFAGQTLHWTAAACAATVGCRYQPAVATLSLPAAPAALMPRLLVPASNERLLGRRARFGWWGGAPLTDSYKICIAPPGIACGSAAAHEMQAIRPRPDGAGEISLDVPARLAPDNQDTQLNWTVAACDPQRHCVYQQTPRSMVVSTLPVIRGAAIGDSVVWGQGLAEPQKFHIRVRERLRQHLPGSFVEIVNHAHSGAAIGLGDGNTRPRLPGEVPTSYPTIFQQLTEIGDAANLDLLLIDGCINDIDVRQVLNPVGMDLGALRALIERHCYSDMKNLILAAAARAPKTHIIVTGYYPILSEDSGLDSVIAVMIATGAAALPAVASAAGVAVNPAIAGAAAVLFGAWVADQQAEIVDRAGVFYAESTAQLQRAVREAAGIVGARQNIAYVSPAFTRGNAIFAARPALYGINIPSLQPEDDANGVAQIRRVACDQALAAGRTDIDRDTCYRASVGHPNEAGAAQYALVIAGYLLNSVPTRPHGVPLNPALP